MQVAIGAHRAAIAKGPDAIQTNIRLLERPTGLQTMRERVAPLPQARPPLEHTSRRTDSPGAGGAGGVAWRVGGGHSTGRRARVVAAKSNRHRGRVRRVAPANSSPHTARTLLEAAIGYGAALLLAFLVAALIDQSGLARRALSPLLVTSQTIPIFALAPLLAIWFGFGITPKILIVALACFFPNRGQPGRRAA